MFIGNYIGIGNYTSGGGEAEEFWSSAREFTVAEEETLQYVVVDKHASMKADYSDLRFCVNPNGTTSQKKFLPYWIASSDENSAGVWVGFKQAPTAASSFYSVWGNASAEEVQSGRAAFGLGGYYFNDFNRSVWYDVNKYFGADMFLDHDPDNYYQSAPSPHKSPLTGTIGYTFRKAAELLHGASEGKLILFRKMTGTDANGLPVFSEPVTVFDHIRRTEPSLGATVTSVTDNAGVARFNHAGAAIYTVGQYVENSGFAESSYNGDFIVSAVGSGYYELTQTKANGETDVAFASDDTGASVSVIIFVGLNNSFMWVDDNGTEKGICLFDINPIGSDTSAYSSTTLRRVYKTETLDGGDTWSEPVMVSEDLYSAGTSEHTTLNNGWLLFFGHGIQRPDLTYPVLIYYSTDNGTTFKVVTIPSPEGTQLNESCAFHKKDADGNYTNTVSMWIRNELGPFYDFEITINENTEELEFTGEPTPSDFSQGTTQSCPSCLRVNMGHGHPDRIFWFYGDTQVLGYYSDDEGVTRKHIGYPEGPGQAVASAASYAPRRTQPKPIDIGDQQLMIFWCRNQLTQEPPRSSNFLTFLDASMMAYKTMDASTLTDTRPRSPQTISNGVLRMNGSLVPGYRTTSTQSKTVPTTHPTTVTFTDVDPDLLFVGGKSVVCRASATIRFTGTVISYSGTTLEVQSATHNGSGTFAAWSIDLNSNLLSNQTLTSRWVRNGFLHPFRLQARVRGVGALSIIGLKRDEVRATSTLTITAATNGTITLKATDYLPSIGVIGTYTLTEGDDTQDVVDGLIESIRSLGISAVVSSTTDEIVITAPAGYGTEGSGEDLIIETTGTVAAEATAFASGVNPETSSALQNFGALGDGVFRIEQANDGFNQSGITMPSDLFDVEIEWDDTQFVGKVNGATVVTKTAANGNGVPNFEACIYSSLSTTVGDPRPFVELDYIRTLPLADTEATAGDDSTGEFTINSLGDGFE